MRVVLALGGNALGKTPQEQLELAKNTAKNVVDLVENKHEVVIVHGNGPQVGMINLALESSNMPFPECGAMSQGYIGYHLQNAIRTELNSRKISKEVVTLVTQVEVDKNDEAFKNPTKPIGSFMSKEEADKVIKEKGYTVVEDSGRGYRRVVPSPKPKRLVEEKIVSSLVEAGNIVITAGGGGVPVYKDGNSYVGTAAVIDKDFASAKVAELVNADKLIILTAVERVMINFGKPDQKELEVITLDEANKYIEEGHFAPGSMLPKVEACKMFVTANKDKQAIIADLNFAEKAIKGQSGTIIKFK